MLTALQTLLVSILTQAKDTRYDFEKKKKEKKKDVREFLEGICFTFDRTRFPVASSLYAKQG